MNKRTKDYAVKLFVEKYGKTPEEAGLPVVDMLHTYTFLYAVSQEEIDTYKSRKHHWHKFLQYFMLGIIISGSVVLIVSGTSLVTPEEAYDMILGWAKFWFAGSLFSLITIFNDKLRFKGRVVSIDRN